MIVYGDPSTQESMATSVAGLKKSLAVADPLSLDDLRALLIQAGMLEQAVEDALPLHAEACRRLTDALARAFVGLLLNEERLGLADAVRMLARIPQLGVALTVKVPEGFAFYALYPESYVASAQRWHGDHPDAGVPLIIGVRSIGTTLSAVVAATLRFDGLDARRTTLRPVGHPFAREAHVEDLGGATHALIVDEGPGLSGSSMVAAAEAAHRAGIPRDQIAFLPGHGGEPGPEASETIRAWWQSAPRYVTPTESLRWKGRTLEATLIDRTGDGAAVEELTGGRWRALVFRNEAEWPPLDAPFERRKVLVRRNDGTAVLWKFVGLTEPGRGRSDRSGPTDVPLTLVLGFLPGPWIDGEPLTIDDATPELLAAIGLSVADSAGPPLSAREAAATRARLAEMLAWNGQEAGLEMGVPSYAEIGERPAAADDRLAPWEWRRLPDGTIVKAGRKSPTGDHTVVGRPPIEWDVAAAIVEWELDANAAAPLLSAVVSEGVPLDPDALRFHCAAYTAFRLGMTIHCRSGADAAERARLERAQTRYRAALERDTKAW